MAESTQSRISLIQTVWQAALIWAVSDFSYYYLLPNLGVQTIYNGAPIAIALYYALWVILTILVFRRIYRGWQPIENNWPAYGLLVAGSTLMFVFIAYIFPWLPPVSWPATWDPPELVLATPWYLLPKSIEILLQQLLIVALIRALAKHHLSLRTTSNWCALLFGGTHWLLALNGAPLGYLLGTVMSATVFGFISPYLILRVRNGLVYTYLLHWLYYAVTIVLTHTIWPYIIHFAMS
jgi:hypothetical protein